MSILGWLIIAMLGAALILIPPATFSRYGEYGKNLIGWIGFMISSTLASAAFFGLVVLATTLIRSGS